MRKPFPALSRSLGRTVALLGVLAAVPAARAATEALPPTVEFNRDVRPLLSGTCFQCHGPDKGKRKANLRLDTEEGANAWRGGRRPLVPGHPETSLLFRRITATDEGERMPPASSGHRLSERQIALLRRWIEQGAKWQKHWSLIPPQRPALPSVTDTTWPRNPIDAFILARLEREGLKPSPEADPTTLIRRVTLDLTGLPPTPAEVDAFLADPSADAYERLVERLLASPRYGERMAWPWLDGARYADTNGYQSDGERIMWRWRDWVIDALNANMPFDRFTVEQIAGDLLPQPTLEQRIATGFNRNHRGNGEGGIIPEEYAVEYVVDRVDTTATVFLGLTMGCARCHDHKFDPIAQKEFYRVFAYFNNVPERGKAVKFGNSPPFIKTPTPQEKADLQELDLRLAAAEDHFARLGPEVEAAQAAWEKALDTTRPIPWSPTRGLVAHFALADDTTDTAGNASPATFREGPPAYASGPIGRIGDFDGKRFLDAADVGHFGYLDKFSLGAWIYPRDEHGGTVLSRMVDTPQGEGYSVCVTGDKLQVNLVKRWLDDALRVETERNLTPGRWYHVLVTYDGSRVASGLQVYVNGRPEKLRVNLDDLNQTFASTESLRIGAGGGAEGRFQGLIGDVRIYHDCLPAATAEVLATTDAITDIVRLPAARRSPEQAHKLRAYFLEQAAPASIRRAHKEVLRLRRGRAALVESWPTTMVMEEMPAPRDTFVLQRGVYDRHGDKVTPGVPASLPPLPPGAPNNRLGLARWLVDPGNPLTARVAVNRYWQMHFGTGLVETAEDFGSQGTWPTHPELLDWLATEFVRSGWDVKALQRLIVTSATYRQSSQVTPALRQKDPENRLLARGPRFRLPADTIRDQALAAAGLLVERVGGPSVKPYQPQGLWKEVSDTEYVQDHGPSLYRRTLYTFWKRTVAPPGLVAFDACPRETTRVRVSRTNTPLQALTLMNDVTYVEAARVLAQRVMKEGGTSPAERLTLAFRLVTARRPRPAELQVLLDDWQQRREEYHQDRKAALQLVSAGEAPRDEQLDVSELAAYTAVANLILNLDEAITRE